MGLVERMRNFALVQVGRQPSHGSPYRHRIIETRSRACRNGAVAGRDSAAAAWSHKYGMDLARIKPNWARPLQPQSRR